MTNQRARSLASAAVLAAAVCALALAAAPAGAQRPAAPPPSEMRDPFGEAKERRQREAQLRSAEMLGTARPAANRSAAAAAEQMREDFRHIQLLRNRVVRLLKSDGPLDYRVVAEETGEIQKRAGRLKTLLVRETPEGEEKKAAEKELEVGEEKLTDALVRMCRRIDSFTENPVFKLPDVVDVQESARAERDLRDIIRLSSAVNKTAERLHKMKK